MQFCQLEFGNRLETEQATVLQRDNGVTDAIAVGCCQCRILVALQEIHRHVGKPRFLVKHKVTNRVDSLNLDFGRILVYGNKIFFRHGIQDRLVVREHKRIVRESGLGLATECRLGYRRRHRIARHFLPLPIQLITQGI